MCRRLSEGCVPDIKDVSLICALTVHIPACPEVRKSKSFTAIRVTRNHYLWYLSLVSIDLWVRAPEEGDTQARSLY